MALNLSRFTNIFAESKKIVRSDLTHRRRSLELVVTAILSISLFYKYNLAVQHLHVSDNNDLRVKFSHLIKLDFDKLKNRKKF